uniref:Uncharacterized protein n=1 Tax=Trichinella nativa TaxID=6335 RepID=A0A0V1KGZ9_9BILA
MSYLLAYGMITISCLKDWFIKWTQILSLLMIMIPMMKMAQNPY